MQLDLDFFLFPNNKLYLHICTVIVSTGKLIFKGISKTSLIYTQSHP